nr:C40 family peptidase [Saccharomonospora glauca]
MTAHSRRFTPRKAAIAAIAATLMLPAAPAAAQPQDDTSDAMERYQELGAKAAGTEEDLAEAEQELARMREKEKQAKTALNKANRELEKAQRSEEASQGKADTLISASFRNGPVTTWSAVLVSDSSKELLQKASALEYIATKNTETLDALNDVRAKADAARKEAAEAEKQARESTAAAERTVQKLQQLKADLDEEIEAVRTALNELSPAERTELQTVQDNGSYLGPPGAANDALQAALSRRGSQYEWGATGPSEFDCSGLTSWAYNQAGINIPRTSRQQWTAGRPVSLDSLLPGDLLFYDDGTGDPSKIHHVGMYVGQGKMVDAPTEGQLVDVRSMKGDGHLIGARRIAG